MFETGSHAYSLATFGKEMLKSNEIIVNYIMKHLGGGLAPTWQRQRRSNQTNVVKNLNLKLSEKKPSNFIQQNFRESKFL